MKRLAGFLIGIYPAAWRERYGDELRAVVEDMTPGWAPVFDLLKGAVRMRFKELTFPKLAAVLSLAGALTGLAISFLFTPQFVAKSVVEMKVIGDEGLAARLDSRLSEFIMHTRSEMLSRAALSTLIQATDLDLYTGERAIMPIEDVVDKMRENLKVSIAPANPQPSSVAIFSIDFTYPDRQKAEGVVKAVVTRIVESAPAKWNVRPRIGPGNQDLMDRIARLQARIDSLEKRLGIPAPEPPPLPDTAGASGEVRALILDPPSVPERPVFPNRSSFMATGLGTGFGDRHRGGGLQAPSATRPAANLMKITGVSFPWLALWFGGCGALAGFLGALPTARYTAVATMAFDDLASSAQTVDERRVELFTGAPRRGAGSGFALDDYPEPAPESLRASAAANSY